MPTRTASPTQNKQGQVPSQAEINQGIIDAENFANEKAKDKKFARGTTKGILGGMKGRNWAKKLGGGKGMQRFGTGVGAGIGGMLGRHGGEKKGAKKAQDEEEQGKLPKSSRTREMAKEGTKELAKAGYVKGVKTAGMALGPWGKAAAIALTFPVEHPKITKWGIILILAILISFFYIIFDETTFDEQQPNQDTPTTSDTCSPAQFTGDAFGKISVCTITVTYQGSAQDIIITDTILPGTAFVSAGQNGTYDKASNTITWDAQKLGLPLNPVNITVTIKVSITTHQSNTTVYNAYAINPVGLANSNTSNNGGVTVPGNLPPSSNNCSGIYSYYMSITPGHKNYGDPNCSLVKKDPNGTAIINKDAILSELKTLKSSEAMGWFICVVPNESSYNANAYLGASTSGKGAYGLVQMNPTGAGNGQYDNGEVIWPLELSNGINYNDKVIGHSFSYWPTSYDPCLRSYGVSVP